MRFRKIDQRHLQRVTYKKGSNQYKKRKRTATKGVTVFLILLSLFSYVGVTRLTTVSADPIVSPVPSPVASPSAQPLDDELWRTQQEINAKSAEWMGLQELQIDRIDRKLEELEK